MAIKLSTAQISALRAALASHSKSLRRAAKKDGQLPFAVEGYKLAADATDELGLLLLQNRTVTLT
jgi:hypothetical protein